MSKSTLNTSFVRSYTSTYMRNNTLRSINRDGYKFKTITLEIGNLNTFAKRSLCNKKMISRNPTALTARHARNSLISAAEADRMPIRAHPQCLSAVSFFPTSIPFVTRTLSALHTPGPLYPVHYFIWAILAISVLQKGYCHEFEPLNIT